MDIKNSGQKASLKISQEVLETIAKVAALEIKGVASIAESQKGLGGVFSKNTPAIETTITDGVAEISVSLNLEFGARIADVCAAAQANIKDNVQTMTGIMVSKVNITVAGIAFPAQSKPAEPEQE